MIIVAKNEAAAQEIAQKLDQHDPIHPVFVHQNRVALAGIKNISAADQQAIADQVEEIIENHHSAIKSSRAFHPEDTIIKTKHSVIGGKHFVLMAGPDSIESPEHVLEMGQDVKAAGATILRGGAFKPRTSPYSYQGNGEAGLKAHRAAADALEMDMVTEILDTRDVDLVDQYTDIFQVGTRNMQNFALLKALGQKRKPVVLKRGMSATIDDLLNAAEYIAAGGNDQIMLMERGIRTFDSKYTRNTFDVGAIPVLQKLTHYPIIADTSHAAGHSEFVTPLAQAAVAAGAQGLMTEIHNDPSHAFVDGAQALTPAQYQVLATTVRKIHEVIA
ncbi:3-deoxy-7-phosphoheptulonate synthase [Convivina intestini]|uniref:3-deoxy-D-arabinoheptulosonate-7-phosphate synthase n=1 Tax=Convivina intestini TaxID=1505726 RepID=A0A2U1DER4_9LACO|nr:3-deoxy-7-phosphoheptulonate synthase [Convivina intestini]PVY86171.1 3-deoxy-D-arabinoheptulosonate-7-phosphate synthase [Convivina intestini]CAH1851400.1 Phospho-2-dehydro-3-deoxyheptonate aldolase [Convivina intestini]CAH1852886.1 Phospho-2-dehydro-3-deoxyheptonate aldolase [Convivina intestini]SDB81228.1 3-deoxy-D-arabinoheptulosonate-7-phosphate synthase [Leuconostocaceae bacterium R-53105]